MGIFDRLFGKKKEKAQVNKKADGAEDAIAGLSNASDEKRTKLDTKLLEDPRVSIAKKGLIINVLKEKKAVEHLIQALRNYDWRVRVNAVNALSDLGDSRAVDHLINSLRDGYWSVRERTVNALNKMGWEPSNDDDNAYYLIAQSKWDEVAALGEPAIKPLIQTVILFPDPNRIKELAKPLGKIGAPAIEQTIKHLTTRIVKNQKISTEEGNLEEVLQEIGETAVDPLIQTLEHEDKLVRVITARTLGRMGDIRAVEPLIETLKDKDLFVRETGADALGWIGDEKAVGPLTYVLKDKDMDVLKYQEVELLGSEAWQKVHLREVVKKALERIEAGRGDSV